MKNRIIAAALCLPLLALAQTQAGSTSGSTASVAPVNVGNPVINLPGAPAETRTRIESNQAAGAATVFVNPPAADTCAKAGFGLSLQAVGAGAALSAPTGENLGCETRADAINLKVTGVAQSVIKARQCQNPAMAQAYEDAGDPCVQRLRPGQQPPVAQRGPLMPLN